MPPPLSHLSFSISLLGRILINFELSELPSRDGVDEYFPANLQQMIPQKPVVLDATDVPIQRPTHRNSQRVASSNTHTLETIIVICITPRGQVSYGSDSHPLRRDTPHSKMTCFLNHGRYENYGSILQFWSPVKA